MTFYEILWGALVFFLVALGLFFSLRPSRPRDGE